MMLQFSGYSLIVTCFIATILIVLFGFVLKCKTIYRIIDIHILTTLFTIILLRLLFPVHIGMIQIHTQNCFFYEPKVELSFTLWDYFIAIWLLGIGLAFILYQKRVNTNENILEYIYLDPDKFIIKDYKYPIIISGYVPSPMILGNQKMILLPNLSYSTKEKDVIIAHEIQHIENKDIYIKHLISLLVVIYWWFIPIYFFKKYSEIFLELRVDANLIKKDKNATKLSYLETLISVSKKNSEPSSSNFFSSSVLTELETRVHYLLTSKKHRWSTWIATIITLFSLIPSIIEFVPNHTPKDNSQTIVEHVEFNDLKDTDKVLQMSGGGWLHGEAILRKRTSLFTVKTEYFNSYTDANAITVAELEEHK